MTRQVRLSQEARNRTLTEAGFKSNSDAAPAPGEGGKKKGKKGGKKGNKNKPTEEAAAPAPKSEAKAKAKSKAKGKAQPKGKGKDKEKAKAKARAKSEEPGGGGPSPKEYCWYHNNKEGGCSKTAKECQYKHEMLPAKLRDKIPRPGGRSATPKGGKPAAKAKGGGKGAKTKKSWCAAFLSPAGCKKSQEECPFPHLAQDTVDLIKAKFTQQK